MLKTSGNTAYKNLVAKHINFLKNGDEKLASHPIVIAKVIARAIVANRPKTRYIAGAGAKPILFLRKILPDRLFDRLTLSLLR